MCHRSVGLIQNALEAAGIATVSLSMVPYLSLAVGTPRALYVRLPFGAPFGEPGDETTQRTVLESALRWLYLAEEPNRVYQLGVRWRRSRLGTRTAPHHV
jgi:D-proline reductase (dithiol) PrdB